MKEQFNLNQKIGEIARIFPKAMDVFMEYNIDFCCGGDRQLISAIEEDKIDGEEVINKINKLYEDYKNIKDENNDFNNMPMGELIDYIVNKHHAFLRSELPVTKELLGTILRVHYVDHGDVLSKLNKLFNSLSIELEEHLIKEEEVLFPLIKKYEKNPSDEVLKSVIKVLDETEAEHDQAGDIIKEMRKITNGFNVPPSGCNTFSRTYQKIEEIEKDLFRHIHLENNILFEKLKNK